MATIMENDMVKGSTPLTPDDLGMLSRLTEYQISQQRAAIWAHKDIKFLAYDDTDLMENGYDSDDEEGMLNIAIEMSQDSMTAKHKGKSKACQKHSDTEDRQTEASSSRKEDGDGPKSCKFCSFVPEFPHSWRPRKFRLVQQEITPDADGHLPSGDDLCSHYVAISYCWPPLQKDEEGETMLARGTYQVRELDGKVRTSRCLDEVLDRAVDFALSCGTRLIWIDQECLPQPTEDSPSEDKDYQELGLQAMDIVYNRALATAGLLQTEVTSQLEMDAIETLMSFQVDESGQAIRWHGPGKGPQHIDPQLLSLVLNFLERASVDRWYTRCWVSQESLSSGSHLIVCFRRRPDISFPIDLQPVQQHFRPPPSPNRDPNKRVSSNNIAIPVQWIVHLIEAAKFFLQRDFAHIGNALVRYGFEPMSFNNAGPILAAMAAFHPPPPKPKTVMDEVYVISGSSYGPRQTVDIVGALTLLRDRECRDVQDRIAIVANMCNFPNRLDTRVLARKCKSLRLAIIALAVMNGDYSLFVPEVYALEALENENQAMTSQPSMRWIWPLNLAPHLINHCKVLAGAHINGSYYDPSHPLLPNGIRLSAYLWSVDDAIDFTPIQFEWSETWTSLKCAKIKMMHIDGETPEDFQDRKRQIVEHLSKGNSLHKQIRNISNKGRHSDNENEQEKGFQITTYADALRIEGSPAMQRVVADIIFAILRYVFLTSESRALALGNSIWHSVRVDAISKDAADELPDNIGDWLFCHPVVLDNPYALLQLDKDGEGSFSQFWLIERIMQDGCLWVGHMANFRDRHMSHPPDSATADLDLSNSEDRNSKGKESVYDNNTEFPLASKDKADRKAKTILQRQFTRNLLAMLTGSMISTEPKEIDNFAMDRRNMARFADTLYYRVEQGEQKQPLEHDHVAAFNVDGPCLLAVPFNGEWEMLPRPAIRSMSNCWVIEQIPSNNNDCGDYSNSESFDDGTQVRARRSENGAKGKDPLSEFEGSPEVDVSEHSEPSYRVLNKVQGVWQIMLDIAMQKFTFI